MDKTLKCGKKKTDWNLLKQQKLEKYWTWSLWSIMLKGMWPKVYSKISLHKVWSVIFLGKEVDLETILFYNYCDF